MKYATFLVLAVIASADVLAWFGHIDGLAWASTVSGTLAAFFAASAWQNK